MSAMGARRSRRVAATAAGALAVAFAAGCGSDKPDFCSDLKTLNKDVEGIVDSTSSGGVNGLKSQLQKIEADAQAVVDSAKSDYPDETTRIESSIQKFKSDIESLPTNPEANELTKAVADAAAVVTAVKDFVDATKDDCD